MLEIIQNTIIRKKVDNLLNAYGLELKHFLPGRLRVVILDWQSREEMVLDLISEIKNDADVTSIEFTKETGSVLIYFNKEAMNKPEVLNRWKTKIEKYM